MPKYKNQKNLKFKHIKLEASAAKIMPCWQNKQYENEHSSNNLALLRWYQAS